MATNLNQTLRLSGPEPNMLKQFALQYATLVHPYLALSICAISLALNCLNCIILVRKQIIGTGNTLLIHLAICDIVKTIAVIPTLVVFYLVYAPGERRTARQSYGNQLLRLVMDDIALTGHTASLWLATLLALQRLICTRSRVAAQHNHFLKEATTRLMIGGVYIFVMLLVLPTYFGIDLIAIDQFKKVYSNTTNNRSTTNVTSLGVKVGEFYRPTFRPGFDKIIYWFFAIGCKIIPCSLLTGFSIALIRTLFVTLHKHEQLLKQTEKRQSTVVNELEKTGGGFGQLKHQCSTSGDHRKRQHAAATKMLITIVLLMIVTQLPAAILVLCAYETYKLLGDLFDLLSLINNATNFILYCKMSAAFRAEFVRLVTCSEQSVVSRKHRSSRLSTTELP